MESLIERLRKRAEIRRQIPGRKSVQEGERDRIADLLEEAARELETLKKDFDAHEIKEVQYHDTIHKLELEIERLKKKHRVKKTGVGSSKCGTCRTEFIEHDGRGPG